MKPTENNYSETTAARRAAVALEIAGNAIALGCIDLGFDEVEVSVPGHREFFLDAPSIRVEIGDAEVSVFTFTGYVCDSRATFNIGRNIAAIVAYVKALS